MTESASAVQLPAFDPSQVQLRKTTPMKDLADIHSLLKQKKEVGDLKEEKKGEVPHKVVKAVYQFDARNDRELSMSPGHEIAVIVDDSETGWCRGKNLHSLHIGV